MFPTYVSTGDYFIDYKDYDMDLLDAGYLDSFSLLNIIVEIEDKLGIALQPTDIKKDNIRTVNEMI